ncbi:lipoprotein-releasing ABC transporter ATP-binding protein LolD [Spiribacter sp. C176]|uniref:Lipoprotein-releasing system ATP-binding protein LolD n=1 Tax=Spiribacter salilacus TaxID=2664894 RepID=A0A6N7QLC2_9GAMM|nr:lipoprotein-releasing ABC transporter ATP-binding protein LolD [Spiribacter salilacus]MRH77276.1 lipoprotein-releasing ABC transporter ATP-binding protein LolD [Spiribacter salilacus]
MSDQPVALECRSVYKTFKEGALSVDVLANMSLTVQRGEQVAIVGRSGAGKSTLLHVLGGLEDVESGEVFVGGVQMSALGAAARGKLRNKRLGFVYQFHHLLGEFTALENVAMPLLIRGTAGAQATQAATQMLARVGLAERQRHKPGELSGGERQRVAIARALITQPDCLLADEPTGNLDRQTAESILALFQEINRENATSVVLVTHDMEVAARMDRRLNLADGQLHAIP